MQFEHAKERNKQRAAEEALAIAPPTAANAAEAVSRWRHRA
jgi:hypothetical protein